MDEKGDRKDLRNNLQPFIMMKSTSSVTVEKQVSCISIDSLENRLMLTWKQKSFKRVMDLLAFFCNAKELLTGTKVGTSKIIKTGSQLPEHCMLLCCKKSL